MNNARQSIHGAPDSMMEDARTALGNQFMGLRIRSEFRTEWSTGFFHLKGEHALARKKINHSREHHILEKQYAYAKIVFLVTEMKGRMSMFSF